MNEKQLKEKAKRLGLFVTKNHNALNAAKDLLSANERIIELEAIINTPTSTILSNQLIRNYKQKWLKIHG